MSQANIESESAIKYQAFVGSAGATKCKADVNFESVKHTFEQDHTAFELEAAVECGTDGHSGYTGRTRPHHMRSVCTCVVCCATRGPN
jgi:hypothetical protein